MLLSLSIADFVLVERLDLEFQPGFSVLTGETGAGKSILLGALALVLGGRADAGVVLTPGAPATTRWPFAEMPTLQPRPHALPPPSMSPPTCVQVLPTRS